MLRRPFLSPEILLLGFLAFATMSQQPAPAVGQDRPIAAPSTRRSDAPSFSHSINAKLDGGAIGNGVVDDRGAIVAAIETMDRSGGGTILVPAGRYLMSARISAKLTNKVSIVGAGRGATVFLWTAPGGGIDLTYGNKQKPVDVSGISLVTKHAGGGTALNINCPVQAAGVAPGVTVDRVDARGEDGGYWTGHFAFVDCWYPSLTRFSFAGRNQTAPPFASAWGIQYMRTQALFVANGSGFHVEDAILQAGTTLGEGLNVGGQIEFVGVRRGIKAQGSVAIQGIHSLHINSYERGITLSNTLQGALSNLLLYKCNLSTSPYIGIELLGQVSNFRISSNHIEDNPSASGGFTGILLAGGAAYNTVTGNTFDYLSSPGAGVILGTGAHDNVIQGNIGAGNGAAVTTVQFNSDAGANNVAIANRSATGIAVVNGSGFQQMIRDNSPLPNQRLLTNNPAPSVMSQQYDLWQTENSSRTILIDLSGGILGQRVTLLFGDAVTGIKHDERKIRLRNGEDIAAGAGYGHAITLVYDGKTWIEQSRSF